MILLRMIKKWLTETKSDITILKRTCIDMRVFYLISYSLNPNELTPPIPLSNS